MNKTLCTNIAQLQDKCKPAILDYEQIKLKEEEERETKIILIAIVELRKSNQETMYGLLTAIVMEQSLKRGHIDYTIIMS